MDKKTEDEENSSSPKIQVISRAIKILKILGDYPDGLPLAQLSKKIGLHRSTVHRIVSSLEEEQFIAPGRNGGNIKLGLALAMLGKNVSIDLRTEMRPFMEKLLAMIDETVDLSIFCANKGMTLERAYATHILQVVENIGATFPLHSTASGKALLSQLDNDEIERLLPEQMPGHTEHTIISRFELLKEIQTIKESGISYDNEEENNGVYAVGMAFTDPLGQIAAISVPVPSVRFKEKEELIITSLKSVIAEINTYFDNK